MEATPGHARSTLPAVTIVPGYRPAIVARAVEMNMAFYLPAKGWSRLFEAHMAADLGHLLNRLDKPINQVWSAVMTTAPGPSDQSGGSPVERTVGVVCVDGECSGEAGVARLRYFVVDESVKGLGIGKNLFRAAMDFVREAGFRECRLSTMPDLTAARKLYEREGFSLVSEGVFDAFDRPVTELNYVWRRPEERAAIDATSPAGM
ncbi:hypothetical protein VTK26DRAFT_3933 [Humicola hyalothermophila]